jgi:hypothetical protein
MKASDQLHEPTALLQGKGSQYPLDRVLDGTPEPVWTLQRTEKPLTLGRNETDSAAIQHLP